MTEEIKDAFVAMDYARKALDKAGINFYTIDSVKKEEKVWLVMASGFLTEYTIRIDATTGDILEFTKK